jgi:hypothetical protein
LSRAQKNPTAILKTQAYLHGRVNCLGNVIKMVWKMNIKGVFPAKQTPLLEFGRASIKN